MTEIVNHVGRERERLKKKTGPTIVDIVKNPVSHYFFDVKNVRKLLIGKAFGAPGCRHAQNTPPRQL